MNKILDEVRLSYSGDLFGHVQGWRFALADYLTFEWGESIPGFWPSDFGPDEDVHEYETLTDMQASPEDSLYALKILDRARSILGAEGLDC